MLKPRRDIFWYQWALLGSSPSEVLERFRENDDHIENNLEVFARSGYILVATARF